MGEQLTVGNPPVEIDVRRSARARRLSLRVSRLDGRVTLTLPKGVSQKDARAFADEKAAWIAKARSGVDGRVNVDIGAVLPVEGIPHTVVAAKRRSAELFDGRIEAPEGRAPKAVEALLKRVARYRLDEAVARYATAIDCQTGKMTLRDTRSRWGSCTTNGDLMFSWRLILAPSEVLDYVAAHEVAHLVEMNHSPAFWAVVHRLMPEYDAPRRWLRQQGPSLHTYRFEV